MVPIMLRNVSDSKISTDSVHSDRQYSNVQLSPSAAQSYRSRILLSAARYAPMGCNSEQTRVLASPVIREVAQS